MGKQTINIGSTPNDNTGDPVRVAFNKVNENFTEKYNEKGWGYYVDSLTTPTITIGTTYTQLTIDALGANQIDLLPREIRGLDHLFLGSKIKPISDGDTYTGRLDLTVAARTGSPTLIEVIVDISSGVAGTTKTFTGYIQTGGSIPYDQSLNFKLFSRAVFLANGGTIYMRTDTGTITVARRNIFIERTYKGDL